MNLSDHARQQLTDTVREYLVAHGAELPLPKCDDAYQRLYPDQVTLYAFRETWNQVQRQLAVEAIQAAARAELQAEIEAQVRAEIAAAAAGADAPAAQEPPSDLPAGEDLDGPAA